MTRFVIVILTTGLLAACEGTSVQEGSNPMDWGPDAYNMHPDERAQMSECTKFASWSYCKRQMLGPGF